MLHSRASNIPLSLSYACKSTTCIQRILEGGSPVRNRIVIDQSLNMIINFNLIMNYGVVIINVDSNADNYSLTTFLNINYSFL